MVDPIINMLCDMQHEATSAKDTSDRYWHSLRSRLMAELDRTMAEDPEVTRLRALWQERWAAMEESAREALVPGTVINVLAMQRRYHRHPTAWAYLVIDASMAMDVGWQIRGIGFTQDGSVRASMHFVLSPLMEIVWDLSTIEPKKLRTKVENEVARVRLDRMHRQEE